MLTLFILALLCSNALTSELLLSSQAENTMTSQTTQRFILNTLRTNESIYSRDGKYKLTMNDNCNLIFKKVKGKVLWTTGLNGKFTGCKAVLMGDSNFEIISDRKTILWSTNTSKKFAGSRTYKLAINKAGNIVVKNKDGKCVWALYGCPLPAKLISRINDTTPQKAIKLIGDFTKIIRDQRKVLPNVQLPLAKNKPVIKDQTPVVFRPEKPKPVVIKPIITKKIFRDSIGGGGGLRVIINKIRDSVPQKEVKRVVEMIKKGDTYDKIKEKAKKEIKKKHEDFKIKDKKIEPKKKNEDFKTEKKIHDSIKNTTWMKNIKKDIKGGVGFKIIKKYLQDTINLNVKKETWKQIKDAAKKKDIKVITKIILRPIRITIKTPKIGKNKLKRRYSLNFPAKRRWVLRFRSFRTFYWRYYYNYNYWVNHCFRVFWWRRCFWRRHVKYSWYQHWYWTSIPYWSWE